MQSKKGSSHFLGFITKFDQIYNTIKYYTPKAYNNCGTYLVEFLLVFLIVLCFVTFVNIAFLFTCSKHFV